MVVQDQKKLKNQQPDIDKIYYYIKGPYKSKYQLLINRREKAVITKLLKNPKVFIDHVYENLEDYSPTKKSINSV